MPLQRDFCEGIRIVPMLLDVPTLRRNKFPDPSFIVTIHVPLREGFHFKSQPSVLHLALLDNNLLSSRVFKN